MGLEDDEFERNGHGGHTSTLTVPDENSDKQKRFATLVHYDDDDSHDEDGSVSPSVPTEDDLEQDSQSERPLWSRPTNKIALVLAGTSVLAVTAFMFSDALTKPLDQTTSKKLQTFPTPLQQSDFAPTEEGKLKGEVALSDQAAAFSRINREQKKDGVPANRLTKPSESKQTVAARPTMPPAPPRMVVPPTPTPQRMSYLSMPRPVYRPTMPVFRNVPPPQRHVNHVLAVPATKTVPSVAASATNSVPQQDPAQLWLAAANLGSYGQVSTNADSTNSSQVVSDDNDYFGPVPTSSRSAVQETTDVLDHPTAIAQVNAPALTTAASAAPTVNWAEESSILTGQPVKTLLRGTRAKGTLITPFSWSATRSGPNSKSRSGSDLYMVQLDQPLLAANGKVALPAGTQLVVEPESVSDAGYVSMKAVSAIVQSNNQQVEQPLPDTAIRVRGGNGKALVATNQNAVRRKQGFNVGQALLSGVGKAAELINRPDSQTSFSSGGSFSSITQNDSPNLLAGVLQGSTSAITEQVSRASQNDQSDINQSSAPLWTLNAGHAVQVFVNQNISF